MKEVWETPFGNATLKINRADKHISDIGERLFASSHTYGPSLHVDGQTGKHFIHYAFTDKELRSDIALMVGDAIHNIRSALDYAWISALERLNPGSINGFTKFPIDPNGDRKKYESTLKVKIPAASFPFRFLVEHVKPYRGGDPDLLALHSLDIDDKHKLLIPMLTVISIEGVELENKDGTVDQFTVALSRFEPFKREIPLESKIKKHGQARFDVTFSKGTAAEGQPVTDTLCRLKDKTWEIVQHLQRGR